VGLGVLFLSLCGCLVFFSFRGVAITIVFLVVGVTFLFKPVLSFCLIKPLFLCCLRFINRIFVVLDLVELFSISIDEFVSYRFDICFRVAFDFINLSNIFCVNEKEGVFVDAPAMRLLVEFAL